MHEVCVDHAATAHLNWIQCALAVECGQALSFVCCASIVSTLFTGAHEHNNSTAGLQAQQQNAIQTSKNSP